MVKFIPEKLNLDELFLSNPPSNIPDFKPIKLIKIISSIYEARLYCKKENKYKKFVSVSSKRLQSIAKNYKVYLDYLERNNIININHSYLNGVMCKQYSFTNTYKGKIRPIYYEDKLDVKTDIVYKKVGVDKNNYINLYSFFDEELTCDLETAMQCIEREYESDIKQGLTSALEKYVFNFVSLSKIYYNDYSAIVDKNGRFHTNLTNLPKKLRKWITYGEGAGCWLHQSQPSPLSICYPFLRITY